MAPTIYVLNLHGKTNVCSEPLPIRKSSFMSFITNGSLWDGELEGDIPAAELDDNETILMPIFEMC